MAEGLPRTIEAAGLQPGEEFLGNFSTNPTFKLDGSNGDILSPSPVARSSGGGIVRTVHQQVAHLMDSGRFSDIRVIPAVTESGDALPNFAGIVVLRNSSEPAL